MTFEILHRNIETHVTNDLRIKMVFISGPRQVGKTTLGKSLLGEKGTYLNWDFANHREKILKGQWPQQKGILVLDEIHKFPKWRNLLKGLYDVLGDSLTILVTGSAKLEAYRRSGDSLQGRYHHYRLHPISISELGWSEDGLQALIKFGGFPEPFFSASEAKANRWRKEYRTRIVREEMVSLEQFNDLGSIELLAMRIPDLVGGVLSINSLREDLQVAHKTVDKWLMALDSLYYTFKLLPFGSPMIRAVKKEKKVYLWDWSLVRNEGARFENWIASELSHFIHLREDALGEDWELQFFRDTEKREVDFVLLKDFKPFAFIECKLSETNISPNLKYLKAKFKDINCFQINLSGKSNYITKEGIYNISAIEFLKKLHSDEWDLKST